MVTFPTLKTGALVQYPFGTAYRARAVSYRFLDASEQRFRETATTRRRWRIRLSLLDEDEIARLRRFFLEHRGAGSLFDFTVPDTGEVVPGCRLASDTWTSVSQGDYDNEVALEIVEAP